MMLMIKRMETDEEIEAKSQLHWQTWREAYDALLPADFQKAMTLEKCRNLSYKYPENTLIAKDGEKIIGFVSYGDYRDAASSAGEVIALYVLKNYYGKGVGQELMKFALTELSAFQDIHLWVLADNARAKAFYQKIGFVFDGQEKMINLGRPFKEQRMTYKKS